MKYKPIIFFYYSMVFKKLDYIYELSSHFFTYNVNFNNYKTHSAKQKFFFKTIKFKEIL